VVESKEMIKISELAKDWEKCKIPNEKIATDCNLCPFGTRIRIGEMKVPICVLLSLIRGYYPDK